ncbi:hypothetical protein GRI89_17150 [Altererythrobacter salegens]|uniref:Uncharacterized protein n=1 Tax=Croceibacterium salegens TaxID=1737568 RepID=A0A6I4SYW8_9SPHN|nr:hypothetical protein [Croceibacterium salegens]MXO61274.1 hypothetical protein [Croceibacterium salegens]
MSNRILATLAAAAACLAALPAAAEVYGGAARDEPLPRFEDRLCPGVSGLQRDQAEMVVGRIRENAEALDIPLADPETCRANLLVAVFSDGRRYINELRERRGYLFENLDREQKQRLFEQEGPVRSFVRVVTRTRDGLVVDRAESLEVPPQTTMAMAHSKIYTATRRDIISGTVLVDKAAVPQVDIIQLADYATMRALAGDGAMDVAMPGGTILSLFDGTGAAPKELTESDRIFLRTLYGTQSNIPAAQTLSLAQRRIDEQVWAE